MSNQQSKLEKKRISILGCGWLGFPLAKRLQSNPITSEIKGSTTSLSKLQNFETNGIEGYLLDLNPELQNDQSSAMSFFDTDSLIISLPPRLGKTEPGFYTRQIESIANEIKKSPVKEIIFISSTGVYPDLNRIVGENDVLLPEESASADMVAAENTIQLLRHDKTVSVLRLGGLLGYNRIPGKYVQGQKNMRTRLIPVNYIHRDDAVGIIVTILERGVVNETFNIVAPLHPTRGEVYESSCRQFGWEAPTFDQLVTEQDFKIISADKFSSFYDYKFLFPDPLKFYYSLEDELR
jgi:nucleoside-diphosphate-sugar epimerase